MGGSDRQTRLRRWAAVAAFAAPLLAGALLRLWNLPAQVVNDDEMHGVVASLTRPVSQLLVGYNALDYCLPLTALDRALMDRGVALTEGLLRAPILASGLAALLLAPGLLLLALGGPRRARARAAALWLAWLFALSPLLVLYTRIARSYAPVVLLGLLAAACFERWWKTERRPWAVGYVVSAALAAWCHLLALPFVAAPLLFALGDGLRRGRAGGAGLRPLIGVAAGLALALALFLVPALGSLLALLAQKTARPGGWALRTWTGTGLVLAGTRSPALAALFWCGAAAGLVGLARRAPRLAAYSSVLVAVQAIAVVLLRPEGSERPLVLARYLLVALPLVLGWLAFGLAMPWGAGPVWGWTRRLAGAGFLLLLAASGPFSDPLVWRSPFMHHVDYFRLYAPRDRMAEAQRPPFYRDVLPTLPPGPVLEYPWVPVWDYNHALRIYQEAHGREVVVAWTHPPDPRLAFRNLSAGTPAAFLASRARYLIVHLDYAGERRRLEVRSWPYLPEIVSPLRERLELGAPMAARLAPLWGEPDFADRSVRVWDLARVRRERAPGG